MVQAALVIESELKLAAKEKGDKKRKIDNVRINLNQVDPAKGFKGGLEGIGIKDFVERIFPQLDPVLLQLVPAKVGS